jgi:hypothetical protein
LSAIKQTVTFKVPLEVDDGTWGLLDACTVYDFVLVKTTYPTEEPITGWITEHTINPELNVVELEVMYLV